MKSLNENFNDIFDSSLIDYSDDFNKSDTKWIEEIRKKEVFNWLAEHDSNYDDDYDNYEIEYNYDLSKYIVNVQGDYILYDLDDGIIPNDIQFGYVNGDFSARGCNLLSFKGLPKRIYGDCELGDNLVFSDEGTHSLEGVPEEIDGNLMLYNLGWELWQNGDMSSSFEGGEFYKESLKSIDLNINLFEQYKKYVKKCRKGVLFEPAWSFKFNSSHHIFYIPAFPMDALRYKTIDECICALADLKTEHEYKLSEIEEFGDQNMSESFNNVFDSSLIDYSNDFEENDIKYKNQILVQNYLKSDNIHFTVDLEKNVDLDEEQFSEKIQIISDEEDYPYIDINGDFRITYIQGYELPEYIHFRNVFGTFDAANIQLISFRGFPKYIEGDCDLSENRGFSENNNSLEGIPENIEGDLDLTHLGWCEENEPDWAEHGITDAEDCYYENLFLLKEIKERVKHCSGTIQLGYEENVPYAYFYLDELDDIITTAEKNWNEKGWLKDAVEYDSWQDDEDWDEDCTKWVQEHWPELEFTGEKEDDEDEEEYEDLDESFNDVFDSSLINYSDDFINQDSDYIEKIKKEKGYISDDEYKKVLNVFKDFIIPEETKLRHIKNLNSTQSMSMINLVISREKFENATGIKRSSVFYKKQELLNIDKKWYAKDQLSDGHYTYSSIWRDVKNGIRTYYGDSIGTIIYDKITFQINRPPSTRPYFQLRTLKHSIDCKHLNLVNRGQHIGHTSTPDDYGYGYYDLDDIINIILKKLYRVLNFSGYGYPTVNILTY